jgi:hypothetical protein
MVRLVGCVKWGLIVTAALVAIALSAPFLVPLDRFIPDLARAASAALGQPVSIDALRLRVLPTPRAVAEGVRIGRKNEVSIGELEIVPDLLSFLSGPRALRLVRAEDVELKEAALGIPGRIPAGEGSALLLRRIVLIGVKLEHSKIKLPEFDLEAELGEGLAVEVAWLETRDKALRVTLDPEPGGFAKVELAAKQWTLPLVAPLRFESLAAHGTLRGAQLDMDVIEGKLYGGSLSGSVLVDWTKQWLVSGEASVAGVDLVPVQRALGKAPRLSGRLKADATFSAYARAPEQLADGLSLDGPFEVTGGTYRGVDLSKVGNLSGQASPEDSTSFEQLQGTLQLHGKLVRISALCVRSPKLVAGGSVEVAPDQTLSGRLDVSLTGTGGWLGVPVALGGTTTEPSAHPTKGYLIGAAVGTFLLPGIGTSIGSSIGGRIEGTSECK